jgi:hypothetical protein
MGVRENVWSKKYNTFFRNVVKVVKNINSQVKYRYPKQLLK